MRKRAGQNSVGAPEQEKKKKKQFKNFEKNFKKKYKFFISAGKDPNPGVGTWGVGCAMSSDAGTCNMQHGHGTSSYRQGTKNSQKIKNKKKNKYKNKNKIKRVKRLGIAWHR